MPNYQLPPLPAIKVPIIQLQREDGFVHPNKETVLQNRINTLFEIYKIKNYTKGHLNQNNTKIEDSFIFYGAISYQKYEIRNQLVIEIKLFHYPKLIYFNIDDMMTYMNTCTQFSVKVILYTTNK